MYVESFIYVLINQYVEAYLTESSDVQLNKIPTKIVAWLEAVQ